jgi:HEPN domain-containing protein
MRSPDEEVRSLVAGWIEKADLDFDTVVRLIAEERFRDIVALHAQQVVEKYLKALLTWHQVEFPKTHVIRRLLILVQPVEPELAQALDETNWLSPFGAEIRYPGDRPGTAPGDEIRVHHLAAMTREAVSMALDSGLAHL